MPLVHINYLWGVDRNPLLHGSMSQLSQAMSGNRWESRSFHQNHGFHHSRVSRVMAYVIYKIYKPSKHHSWIVTYEWHTYIYTVYIYIWLVVWNHGILWLSRNSWEFHNPNWRTPSFFREVGIPPTSDLMLEIPYSNRKNTYESHILFPYKHPIQILQIPLNKIPCTPHGSLFVASFRDLKR